MAMLAEPRRRQKYSINPRGLEWSNDEDKFGQKLLEKMGWKKGKGLGAKEDGSVDHIKVSAKMDQRGVGCTKQTADNWIAHQDDYSAILAELNASHGAGLDAEASDAPRSAAVQCLDEKSKNSKSRVHYQKFTKGKDLSRYAGTDLDCIFGKRQRVAKPREITDDVSIKQTTDAAVVASSDTQPDHSFGVVTVTSTTSLADYFAKKMADLKRSKSADQFERSFLQSRGETKDEPSTGDDDQSDSGVTFTARRRDASRPDNTSDSKRERKREKRTNKMALEVGDAEMRVVSEITKKERRRKRDECLTDADVEEAIVVPSSCDAQLALEESLNSDGHLKGKKKKRRKTDTGLHDAVGLCETVDVLMDDSDDVKKKKKRKKDSKQSNDGCTSKSLEVGREDEINSTETDRKKKKKKKGRSDERENEEVATDRFCDVDSCEVPEKRKKKSRKNKD